jgi:hypothetical protein
VSSRAVLVVGMHRSGTSAIARGLKALSVYLGDNLLDGQPDNPTGYWEDKTVVEINQRALEVLGLKWDDVSPIEYEQFEHYRIRLLRIKAAHYLKSAFTSQALWGFKDPRTIRLLPLWLRALRDCDAEDAYVVAIRNPLSVAASLFRRQEIKAPKAHRLWLVHTVPFLHELREKPFVVVDYDLLMLEPRLQLERIARKLSLPSLDETRSREIDHFAAYFLNENLRHSLLSPNEFVTTTGEGQLARAAYLLLYDLATDRVEPGAPSFWSAWEKVQRDLETLLR